MWGRTVKSLLLSLSLFSGAAQAALHDRGNGLIYDDVLNITWLQDANYAKTSGYDTDGWLSWYEAKSWAANLTFGGFDDWRLPKLEPLNGSQFSYDYKTDGTSDWGFNIRSTKSELAHLYYVTLGNRAFTDGGCDTTNSLLCMSNTGPFQNIDIQHATFWFGNGITQQPDDAWNFYMYYGYQNQDDGRHVGYAAWAVRDGDVITVSVPEPNTVSLIVLSLLGVTQLRRRQQY